MGMSKLALAIGRAAAGAGAGAGAILSGTYPTCASIVG
jgi:hypothetical protein